MKKKKRNGFTEGFFLDFLERESHFSLDYRAIGPSEFFGARRKAVLHGEAYAWAPILRSFDKLCDVGRFILLGLFSL